MDEVDHSVGGRRLLVQDSPCLKTDGSLVTILGTCVAQVEHRGRVRRARALLDSGSGLSFVTARFVHELGLKKIDQPTKIKGFQQTETPAIKYRVNITFKIPTGTVTTLQTMEALVVDSITGDLPSGPLPEIRDSPHLKGLKLADPSFDRPGRVDVLFGVDFIPMLLRGSTTFSANRLLCTTETAYGWVISGRCSAPHQTLRSHLCLSAHSLDGQTQDLLVSFLESEGLPPDPNSDSTPTEDEQRAEDHFVATHSRQDDGRFVVQLPRKADPPPLGCSRDRALRRHHQNVASLTRRNKFREFQDAIWDYAKRQHAERVPDADLLLPEQRCFYLPTHGVVKEQSTTTKLCIVFDASAASSTGHSLNDQLLAGPNLYPQLIPILLRFRMHVVGMTADIGKMFREIALDPCERDYHRFLLSTEDGKVEDWRMQRLTFGVASSPFLATRVLRQAARIYNVEFPQAALVILSDLYVDDCIAGTATLEEAVPLRTQLNSLLQKIGMTLRKWRSSSPELLATIPTELLEKEPVQLLASPKDSPKTLGIHWDTASDQLHVPTPPPSTVHRPSKRQVSSQIARVYDIMGFFSPAVLQLKLILQQLWRNGSSWDDPLPDSLSNSWQCWQAEQYLISDFSIPRCCFNPGKQTRSLQLHGFSDASTTAYGGAVYLRTTYADATVTVSLLLAKSKVVPASKPSTIPRLELSGACLLARLLVSVADSIQTPPECVFAWSDSTITLTRLNSPPGGYDAYVKNRIVKTIENVPASRWRHVPTDSNPADLASRGCSLRQLVESELWWGGPEWLSKAPSQWPNYNGWRRKTDDPPEVPCHTLLEEPPPDEVIRRFSSYRHMLKVISWMRLFCHNAKNKRPDRRLRKSITIKELQDTEVLLLAQSQRRSYPREMACLQKQQPIPRTSSIIQRRPILGPDQLMRVGGRLQRIDLELGQKHPIILHHRDTLTRMICNQLHLDNMHTGPSGLMALLSLEYSIIGAKQLTKAISRDCVKCKRFYARTAQQLMGQLPACRATPAPAFQTTGVDFAGPFNLRRGHVRKPTIITGYACIFVCLVTRAIHLEVVLDLTTEAFLSALRCFVARRGVPATIRSDNGSNFVGAHRVLDAAYKSLISQDPDESLIQYLTSQRIEWLHTPARSPHFGGIWEAGVKQMKTLLFKTLDPYKLTPEQLSAVLTEAEAILNSRPLVPMDSAPTDGEEILTPAHFLIGRSLKALPHKPDSSRHIQLLRHWALCQCLTEDLWRRWSGEYLQLLQKTQKWRHPTRSVQIGDVVLLKDDELFMRSWPLARVTDVHPGPDGLVRVATVRTSKGSFRRAVTRLVPLLQDDSQPSTSRPPEDVRVQKPSSSWN